MGGHTAPGSTSNRGISRRKSACFLVESATGELFLKRKLQQGRMFFILCVHVVL
jgi:hypothetical protein